MDVLQWARNAEPGARVVYAHLKEPDDLDGRARPELRTAYAAHTLGLVFLAQRRKGTGFDYEATRISERTAKILGALSLLDAAPTRRGRVSRSA